MGRCGLSHDARRSAPTLPRGDTQHVKADAWPRAALRRRGGLCRHGRIEFGALHSPCLGRAACSASLRALLPSRLSCLLSLLIGHRFRTQTRSIPGLSLLGGVQPQCVGPSWSRCRLAGVGASPHLQTEIADMGVFFCPICCGAGSERGQGGSGAEIACGQWEGHRRRGIVGPPFHNYSCLRLSRGMRGSLAPHARASV